MTETRNNKGMFGMEKATNFLKETQQELKKVTWPTWNELWQAAVVVIVVTFFTAAFIAFVDFCISNILRIVIS
ncbi:MAG: preprotein translocase subunit SecE [Candidatus Omnitrophota bacterium]